jgi:hypothetical protein
MRTILFLLTVGVIFVVVNGIITTPGTAPGGAGLTAAEAQAALAAKQAAAGVAAGNAAPVRGY